MRHLDGLDPAQLEAVTTRAAPLCILAAAGSGKTRVLTRRIAHVVATGAAGADHVLALTFTRRAAAELRDRLGALGVRPAVAAGTFHALAWAQLRQWWAGQGRPLPHLLDSKAGLVATLLPAGASAAEVAGEIEWAKARRIPPAEYVPAAWQAGRTTLLGPGDVAVAYDRYEVEKRRRGAVDFDDLVVMCADALRDDPVFAAAQRWRFRHLFVDEFQDVNPAQFCLLRAWLGDRPDLCVVGDPNQAIYAWNGADPRYIAEFDRFFPGATVLRLDTTYRATPEIAATAVAALGAPARAPVLRAARPAGAPRPTLRAFPTDRAEAEGVARAVRAAHPPGASWGAIAVLARTHGQLLRFEEAFRAARIPYRSAAGRLVERPEVRGGLEVLHRQPPAVPFTARLADLDAYAAELTAAEPRANVDALAALAREYAAADPGGTVGGFRGWLAGTGSPAGTGEAVELVTFHAAKGLEWPVVFVAGLERGFVPIGGPSGDEAEERRLLYVALTRAIDRLHLSWAGQRSFRSVVVDRDPSPWLADLAATTDRPAGPAGTEDPGWPTGAAASIATTATTASSARIPLDRARAALGPAEAPARLDGDLRAWRARVARAAAVPVAAVVPDRTLTAVVATRPATVEELGALPGIGPLRAARYGEQLLALVARHAS